MARIRASVSPPVPLSPAASTAERAHDGESTRSAVFDNPFLLSAGGGGFEESLLDSSQHGAPARATQAYTLPHARTPLRANLEAQSSPESFSLLSNLTDLSAPSTFTRGVKNLAQTFGMAVQMKDTRGEEADDSSGALKTPQDDFFSPMG